MEIDVKKGFPCKKCGACCRNIGKAFFVKNLALSDGICMFLDQSTNLCMRYENRPIFCNVDAFYDKYMTDKISRDQFYKENIKTCEELRMLTNGR